MKIDHIGIAVAKLADSLPLFQQLLGLAHAPTEDVPTESVRVAMLPVGDSRIELLEPLDKDGPIARFLQRRGEGIHHIALAVDDIEASIRAARARGLRVVYDPPRHGTGGRRITFLDPRSTHGVLLEFCEHPTHGSG
jgi:methylmalonyl-CoA epimerase